MSVDVIVDYTKFTRAVRLISSMTGKDLSDVIKHEAERILETTHKRTSKAKLEKITIAAENYFKKLSRNETAKGNIISRSAKSDKLWFVRKDLSFDGRTKYYQLNGKYRFPNDLWNYIQAELGTVGIQKDVNEYKKRIKKYVTARKKAAGLAKQSWQLIQKKLNEATSVNNKVLARKGNPDNFSFFIPYENAQVLEDETNLDKYAITLINYSAAAYWGGGKRGQKIINGVIAGRTAYYQRNLKEGVFNNINSIISKYPGLYTTNL